MHIRSWAPPAPIAPICNPSILKDKWEVGIGEPPKLNRPVSKQRKPVSTKMEDKGPYSRLSSYLHPMLWPTHACTHVHMHTHKSYTHKKKFNSLQWGWKRTWKSKALKFLSLGRETGPFGFQTNLETLKTHQLHLINTNVPQKPRHLFSKLVSTSYKKSFVF